MYITMQGDWTVAVKSKSAAFDQRFVISGSDTADGIYDGVVGTSVNVNGKQWTISIQNNPGGGFQASEPQLKFPRRIGNEYVFDIHSNDAGGDSDFNDLVLTCSSPASLFDHIVYGNVTLYSGLCLFNPCRERGIFVIETPDALREALKNPKIYECIQQYYPDRIPIDPLVIEEEIAIPEPPGPFKPIVLDLNNTATLPNTQLTYESIQEQYEGQERDFSIENYKLIASSEVNRAAFVANPQLLEFAGISERFFPICRTEPADNITLSFEEYDRTAAEKAGGAYTGTGNRQLLGDTITDMFGNYIFRYRYIDLAINPSFPGPRITISQPDIIVKVISKNPFEILYESAPYYDVPNLKRINLCIPKSRVQPTSVCFNGNLIGSLGNVFIGGNQNASASTSTAALTRDGYNNYLSPEGTISVDNSQAGFSTDCAAWGGVIDMKGCMYDVSKSADENLIAWYTIRIRRADTPDWNFVSQEYLHPRFSKRSLPNYNGDLVGPFPTVLNVDGGGAKEVPAYRNIQRETFALGVDWEFSSLDRYMRLNTSLYDNTSVEPNEPGRFFLRVDGYDAAGSLVANATDLIALYIHNKPLVFSLSGISLDGVTPDPCNLYRITPAQERTAMRFSFQASDAFGFVNAYNLTTGRCPAPTIALNVSPAPMTNLSAGESLLQSGAASANIPPRCPGYRGTLTDFASPSAVNVVLQPPVGGSWIQPGEIFTRYSLSLIASKRVTNGYNSGVSGNYRRSTSVFIQPL